MKEARTKAKEEKDAKAKKEIFEAARKKVHDEVFTDEQRAKAKELRRKHNPLAGIATDEQIDKADEIMKAAFKEATDVKDPKEKRKIIKAAQDKIENEILTEEQRTKLKEKRSQQRRNMRNQFLGKVGLTEEQQAKADAIMDEAMAKAKDVEDPKEHFKIMAEARKKIRDEVFTDEQREELKKMWNKHHGPRGPRGRGNRPPKPGKGDDQTPPPPPPATGR